MPINTLVVLGLGLIGSSLAAALKPCGTCRQVIGVARRQQVCDRALELGLVDRACTDIRDVAAELGKGDVIVIALPTLAIRQVLETLVHCVSSEVTITDGASVKGSVRDDVLQVYGTEPPQVVLGHPIAGSEQSGIEAVDPELYKQHRVILTPFASTGQEHLQRVYALWQAAGAEVIEMSVDNHDTVLAATSHLPHVIAFSLVDTLAHDSNNANIFRYAAGGFRDFTRIASSDAVMWRDIMLANRQSVLHALDLFGDNLKRLRTAIDRSDSHEITGVFTRAKVARDRFMRMLSHQSYSADMQSSKPKNLIFRLAPGGKVRGCIRVPGDKSCSHRAIMLGALAEGVTRIEGFLEGEDALATLQSFRDMGVVIEGPDQGRVVVNGVGLHGLQPPEGPLYLGNSGTSMRLLAGLLAGQSFDCQLTGDPSLSRRPMQRIAAPLRAMGAHIDTAEGGTPPLHIRGGQRLQAIEYALPMASAQVKSCVLLAGLYAQGETRVTEPQPTRDHTERMLTGFGYPLQRQGSCVSLAPGGSLQGCDIDIPADISSATFFLVAAAISPGSELTLTHVGVNPTRIGVINILQQMGADLHLSNQKEVGGEPVADIHSRYAPHKGIAIPQSQVPLAIDEFPALFIAAACAQGQTVLSGAEELRVKETDRIQAMADGLMALGVHCEPQPDGMIIEGGALQGGEVDSFGDHRIAMAFAVAALAAQSPITINNCANVATSFPNFSELANKVGISLEVIHS